MSHRGCYTGVPIRFILIVLLLLSVRAGPAAAELLTWNLDGVTFTDDGIATGSFTLDTALYNPILFNTQQHCITNVDIQVDDPVVSYHFTNLTVATPPFVNITAQGENRLTFFDQGDPVGLFLETTPGRNLSVPGVITLESGFPIDTTYLVSSFYSAEGTGSLVSQSAVPESLSILFLGYGLAGLCIWDERSLNGFNAWKLAEPRRSTFSNLTFNLIGMRGGENYEDKNAF